MIVCVDLGLCIGMFCFSDLFINVPFCIFDFCESFRHVCSFVWYHSRIFHSYGEVTITCEGLKIFTYTRHSWPLSSEGSLACHIHCDTGHPPPRNRNTHTCCRAFGSGFVPNCFKELGRSRPGIEPLTPTCEANALYFYATAAVSEQGGQHSLNT